MRFLQGDLHALEQCSNLTACAHLHGWNGGTASPSVSFFSYPQALKTARCQYSSFQMQAGAGNGFDPHDMGDGSGHEGPASMDQLLQQLEGAEEHIIPDVVMLKPSVDIVVREAGPDHLGHSVEDLSRALHGMVKEVHEQLVPDRISVMTVEDVPQIMTPVAKSLNEVLTAAATVRHRLDGIAEASNYLLTKAAAHADKRLKVYEGANKEDDFVEDPNVLASPDAQAAMAMERGDEEGDGTGAMVDGSGDATGAGTELGAGGHPGMQDAGAGMQQAPIDPKNPQQLSMPLALLIWPQFPIASKRSRLSCRHLPGRSERVASFL